MAAKIANRRVRRQKQFIAVGTACLLAILGYELPKMLGGHGNPTTASPATTAPAVVNSPTPLASGQLPNTDRVAVERDTGQLISFGLFKSKDPFVQQLSTTAAPAPPTTVPMSTKPTTTTPAPGATSPASTTPVIPPPTTPTPPASTTPTAPPGAPTSVLISTNGVCQQISVNGTFPANEDIFRLVAIAKDGKSIKVGIVGGSYDSGQPTATLKLGQKLTLVNTADGTRYVIVLEAACAVVVPNSGPTPAQATTTTPAPPPPATTSQTTTTATTPIVTDGLDTTPSPSG